MTGTPYEVLPEPPETISATGIIVRMIDALAFRYRWSLEGLDNDALNFRPAESSMSLRELLEHIYFLTSRLHACFVTDAPFKLSGTDISSIRRQTLEVLQATRDGLLQMKDSALADCKVTLKGNGHEFSFWYFLNGPLSDALTHVGQINAWRRMAGSPVPKANVFLGKPPSI